MEDLANVADLDKRRAGRAGDGGLRLACGLLARCGHGGTDLGQADAGGEPAGGGLGQRRRRPGAFTGGPLAAGGERAGAGDLVGGRDGPGDRNQLAQADRYITGSDLDALIAECGPRLWLCGHAHTTHHVTIGNTQISANPRAGDGPGNVNPDFVDSYVLDL